MGSKRQTAAAVTGLVGALAIIVGSVLPWVTVMSPGQSGPGVSIQSRSAELNGLLVSNGFLLLLGIAAGIAAGWLWAGNEPKKAVVALGPLSVGVMTLCIWVITKKDEVVGYGLGGPEETATLKFGIYVTLIGGIIGLIAAIVAALATQPVAPASDVFDGADPPTVDPDLV